MLTESSHASSGRRHKQVMGRKRSALKAEIGEEPVYSNDEDEDEELKTVPSFAFFNTAEKASKWRVPTPAFAQGIVRSATKCQSSHHGESSWNMEVHRRVLDFAFRDSEDVLVGDYRYCTGAQIIQAYKPLGAPSKCVDFCLCIEPPQSSIEHKTIRNLISIRPGLLINHTDWGDLCTNPIALSIETKRQDDWNKALLQVGTWHSAQWRALPTKLRAIEFLTGIIVRGHSWYFLASTLEDVFGVVDQGEILACFSE
ncbi:hypothetical protein DER45DRAFT_599938 [Fusarium avenaceum]|nr:hypothetical protein DER45DRAFT_599938 [Fusarium avenaceum]